jgi:hypothetical protein
MIYWNALELIEHGFGNTWHVGIVICLDCIWYDEYVWGHGMTLQGMAYIIRRVEALCVYKWWGLVPYPRVDALYVALG